MHRGAVEPIFDAADSVQSHAHGRLRCRMPDLGIVHTVLEPRAPAKRPSTTLSFANRPYQSHRVLRENFLVLSPKGGAANMLKGLPHPDQLHLQAAIGWLELGNHVEANEELEK